ncbi:hypothetical protein DITRI_Ditri13aG0076200 [Diplodiscus trichospermus]
MVDLIRLEAEKELELLSRMIKAKFWGHISAACDNVTDPIIVEAIGAKAALEFAWQLSMQRIQIEGDNLIVIKLLRSNEPNLYNIGHLIKETKDRA